MSADDLTKMIDALIAGDISEEDHTRLQEVLQADSGARELYRQRIDLEASLRTWAQQPPDIEVGQERVNQKLNQGHTIVSGIGVRRPMIALFAIAATLLLITALRPWLEANREGSAAKHVPANPTAPVTLVGMIQERDCRWREAPKVTGGQFATGTLSLETGVARLSFRSGTDLVVEAPCILDVTSADSARLLAGNVFVNVTELSNGFTLETPEARIVDEGTQYAVSLEDESAEVHVFDGSVLWIVEAEETSFQDRITSGQARSYQRSDPTRRGFVPFGKRQFVRQLERQIREQAGETLLAYDGFENLAGRMRRGRSGFGWSGGWQPVGRGRGRIAEVVAAPDDVVHDVNRTGRRLLSLVPGDDMRRELELPFDPASGHSLYVSLLIERLPSTAEEGLGLLISLEPEMIGRARRRLATHFGISTDGFPYINSGGVVRTTATGISDSEVYLLVMKLPNDGHPAVMRVYRPDEKVDEFEPDVWTVTCERGVREPVISTVRMASGASGGWQVDELRLGTSWRGVTQPSVPSP